MKTIDFKKSHKDLFTATQKIKEVKVAKASYLRVEGVGAPGGKAFQQAIERLYSVAYTAKFDLKARKVVDFGVSKLEAIWPEGTDYEKTPQSKWRWQLLIRIPDELTGRELARVRKLIAEKKGLDTSNVERWTFTEGRCVQVMHVGPYDRIGKVYAALAEHIAKLGMVPAGAGHEIYISDPRRVAPEKIKTIVRMPMKKGKR